MFARILVPIDFSAASDAALARARELANRFDAELHLLHVAENSFLRAVVSEPQSAQEASMRWLQDRLTDADRRRGAVTLVEQSDEPANDIVRYATSAEMDLIVIGTHGRTGLARLALGSVAEAVIRKAPCPVLTVHATNQTADALG